MGNQEEMQKGFKNWKIRSYKKICRIFNCLFLNVSGGLEKGLLVGVLTPNQGSRSNHGGCLLLGGLLGSLLRSALLLNGLLDLAEAGRVVRAVGLRVVDGGLGASAFGSHCLVRRHSE